MLDITNAIFHDADKAREYLEAQRWPDGPVCPHCNAKHQATKLQGKSTRPGVYKCKACEQPYSVTVGTVFERSKIPLNKWLAATWLLTSSKKGISALQVQRMLGVTYKTAWFMCHRIREAMAPTTGSKGAGPLGGAGKIIEADETFVGGKARNVHKGKPIPPKRPVVALVERGGEVRARHVPDVTAKTIREVLVTQASRKSDLNTDESLTYYWLGREFNTHGAVNHSAGEYVSKDGKVTTNSAEAFFALLKRKVYGTHHAISEQHLQRYVSEAAFEWNNRIALGIDDTARANAALRGIGGKRLTYRRPGAPKQA
jgi:transposase-like protein